jgi:hypothetical protein
MSVEASVSLRDQLLNQPVHPARQRLPKLLDFAPSISDNTAKPFALVDFDFVEPFALGFAEPPRRPFVGVHVARKSLGI